jgi:uncharacterized protein (DUF1697 family)
MARHILLLRGINLGSTNRIAMPALREALADAGFGDVRSHLPSGNIVVTGSGKADDAARKAERVIEREFGLKIPVVARTSAQLAKVARLNPLADVANNPKRYQVSFLAAKPTRAVIQRVEQAAAEPERVVVHGREIYAWHPDGVARSRLWALLAGKGLGITATARNWTTVTALVELARE